MPTVTVVYPTDPLAVVPGGTDTCIRDILRCAPEDIRMKLVGVTTDTRARPVHRWVNCTVSGREFEFYGLMSVADLESQKRVPLSLQFTLRLLSNASLFRDADVIQLNRIEPALGLLGCPQPKLLIIHQNMEVVSDKNSDIRWKYFPGLYFWIEKVLLKRVREIFIVREDAVEEYRKRFPEKKKAIRFLPTWMNPGLFYELDNQSKHHERESFSDFPISPDDQMLVFVGRLDHQKDPLYLIDILEALKAKREKWKMLIIGDGVLRSDVEEAIYRTDLKDRVLVAGARLQDEVARFVRASDLLLLSSAYEGMPRCVVEALGCGVPVVTTNAGEVSLLVNDGENGFIVKEKDPEEFANKVECVLSNLGAYSGRVCLDAVNPYKADVVLEDLYGTYRNLARSA
ncbi:MAG: glycosyltransferase family 4 protein [Pseudomonadota bacterium]